MAVTLSVSITQNSQSVANNTSSVTVVVTATYTNGSFNRNEAPGVLTIDGTDYSFSSSFNYSASTSTGTKQLFSKTVNVSHNSDGTKTLYVEAYFETGVSSGNISAAASKTLTTIPRKSSMSAGSGTLGTAQTLSVTRQASSFTHTITYKCGNTTGTIATKSSSTSISWTPPLDLAKENTTGTSVSVTLTITTYNGNTSVGSNSYTITCSIPASVKPSCTISVTDPTGFANTYGAYIMGQSKFQVSVTATTSYGSAIASYNVTANDVKYTTASFTTGVLTSFGTLSVTATVTDKRGRSGSATVKLNVLECIPPTIDKLTVNRCNADGTENGQGEYVKVTFSATVTNLDGQNTASYALRYKKSTETDYTEVALTQYANKLTVTDATYIFKADTGASYDVEVGVTDKFATTKRTTSASTAFTIMHWKADGTGMGIGKIAELSNLLDIGLPTRFFGGIQPPVLEAETDLNDVVLPNTYTGENVSTYNYANCPVTSGTFSLLVESCGEAGQVRQVYTTCSKYKPERFVRFYYQGTWGPWCWASTDEYVLYENEDGSTGTITLSASASHYRYLDIYFTDNNGKSGGFAKVWNPDGQTVMLNIFEAASTIYSRQTSYDISGTTMTPDTSTASYVRFTSSGGVSTSIGTNYIKIVRVIGRA